MCAQRVSPTVLRGLPGSKREVVARMATGTGKSVWPSPRRRLFVGSNLDLGRVAMPSLLDPPPPMTMSRKPTRPSKVDQRDYWGSN